MGMIWYKMIQVYSLFIFISYSWFTCFYFWWLAFDCRGTVSMGPKRLIEHVVLAYAYLIIPIQIRWRMHSPIFPSLVKRMQPWPWMLVNSHMAMWAESISSPSWVKTTACMACMACTPLKAKTELPKRRAWKVLERLFAETWPWLWPTFPFYLFYTSTKLTTWWTRWALALRCRQWPRHGSQIDWHKLSQPVEDSWHPDAWCVILNTKFWVVFKMGLCRG